MAADCGQDAIYELDAGCEWHRLRLIAGLVAVLCLLVLPARADEPANRTDRPAARPVACWFKPPADHTVSCYRVRVPERRDATQAGGMMLDLPVVVISTPKDRKQDDPVVYLSGGPGDGDWLDGERIGYWWTYLGDNPWLRHRDLVLFDQRGVGLTEPRADCPELAALDIQQVTFGNDHARLEEAEREAGKACLARLEREGHDAAAYTTKASAADLHDIFQALGFKRWNVYGLSYGTRLALTYMRDFPGDIRGVILDSVYPPQIRFLEDDAWRTDRAFRLIFDACRLDRRCHHWYPDLAGRLERLIARLDATPLQMDRTDPSNGKPLHFGFTGQMLLNHLFLNMYNRSDIERVPQIIDIFDRDLTKRETAQVDDYLASLDDRPDWGDAMATTIDCQEDVAFNDLRRTQANYRGYPLLRGLAEDDPAPVCPVWVQHKSDPRLNQPISSALPTLVLSGVFDPVTPPQYARLAASTLVNSFYVEFPGLGHDVLGNDTCAGRLADDFLNDPARVPTDPCLGTRTPPAFEPPVN